MSVDTEALLHPARSRRWRALRWGALAVVALAIGIGAVFGARLGTDPSLVDSPLIGQPAPTRQVPYLEQPGEMSLADLRGRVVVVNFWASWCVECREEHPALLTAARDYRSAGVTFLGVNYQDGRDSAIGFLDELGRGGRNYRYVTDPGSRLAMDFGVFGVPETFVLDRSGRIVTKITGASDYPLLARTLDAVLAGQQPRSADVGPVRTAPPPDPRSDG
jgi:cytochrome c biogenesis protein CcmG/thiol:disulfide interchange protein DsbE